MTIACDRRSVRIAETASNTGFAASAFNSIADDNYQR
jgi:hypothetical protein